MVENSENIEDKNKILVLLDDGNKKVFREWVRKKPEYKIIDPDTNKPLENRFDLCIIDSQNLSKYIDELESLKENRKPEFYPILFVQQENKKIQEKVWDIVDEIVIIPTKQKMLDKRIENLLDRRNISKKQSREKQKVKKRYKTIFESANDAIFILDPKKESILDCNQKACEILGYNKTELLSLSPIDDLHPNEEQRFKKFLEKTLEKGKNRTDKLSCTRKDGTVFPAEISASTIQSKGEKNIIASARNISELKKREEKLKITKERLEEAQLVADIGHWSWDIQTNNIEWSDQVYRIFGLSPDEFDPNYPKFLEYVHPEDREKVQKDVQEALEKNNYNINHKIIREDGDIRIVQEIGEVYYEDGEPKRMLGTVQDVTEKEKQKRELETFKKAVEQSGNSIYITDKDGTIEYVNPAFEKLTGYTKKEAIGQTPRILRSGKHDIEFYEDLWNTILSGEIWENEVINKRKNGELYHVNRTIAPIYHREEIKRFVAVNNDITEIKKHQERLEVLTRVLRHDILNIMNIILTNAEYLKKKIPSNQQDILDVILKNIEKTVEISKNSRKIQKLIEREQIPRKSIDISEKIKERVKIIDNSYPEAEIKLDLPESAKATTIQLFDSVIDNAIENAIEHNDKNIPKIKISVKKGGQYIIIKISDNGPGLREEQIDILERGTETDLEHLEGLGLWIMNWVVNESGGKIKFSQKRNDGNIVIIRLQKPKKD